MTKRQKLLISLSALLGAIGLACLATERFYAKQNPGPNAAGLDALACLETIGDKGLYEIGDWEKGTLAIEFHPHAPVACANPRHPLIKVVGLVPVDGFVEIVRIDGVPGKPVVSRNTSVYSAGPIAASGYFAPPFSRWEARVYALRKDGGTLRVIGGLTYGFNHDLTEFGPRAIEPRAVAKGSWASMDESLIAPALR